MAVGTAGGVAPTCSPDAAEAKEAGNKAFAAGRFEEAYDHFTEAIRRDPASALLRSNRAGALASLGRHADALADAELCVSLQPDWWKGYTRRGHAQFHLQRYGESEVSFREALRLNPQERTIAEGLERAVQRRQESEGTSGGLRAAAGGSAAAPVPAASAAAPAEAAAPVGAAFERRSSEEIRQKLQQGIGQLDDAALDAELRGLGIAVTPGMTRAEKERILLHPAQPAAASAHRAAAPTQPTVASAASGKSAAPSAALSRTPSTRGEKVLERRRRWLEEWKTWDDSRLVHRLIRFGIDAEGCCREDLLDLLLEAETERFNRQCCTRGRLQVLALLTGSLCIMGTFAGVAVWFVVAGG